MTRYSAIFSIQALTEGSDTYTELADRLGLAADYLRRAVDHPDVTLSGHPRTNCFDVSTDDSKLARDLGLSEPDVSRPIPLIKEP